MVAIYITSILQIHVNCKDTVTGGAPLVLFKLYHQRKNHVRYHTQPNRVSSQTPLSHSYDDHHGNVRLNTAYMALPLQATSLRPGQS